MHEGGDPLDQTGHDPDIENGRDDAQQQQQEHGEDIGGGEWHGVEEGRGPSSSMPQCYSTPAADPSIGAWRRCDEGAEECSPIDLEYMARQSWVLPNELMYVNDSDV